MKIIRYYFSSGMGKMQMICISIYLLACYSILYKKLSSKYYDNWGNKSVRRKIEVKKIKCAGYPCGHPRHCKFRISSTTMAGPTGLEPATSRVTGECSNQLSYDPIFSKGEMILPKKTHLLKHFCIILPKQLGKFGRIYYNVTQAEGCRRL